MQLSKFQEVVQRHVNEQKKRESENVVDWDERKRWWQLRVSKLLDQVDEWLAPLISSNTIIFTRPTIACTEETLGTYSIESGLIQLGRDSLKLKPVASVILGGFGRVDVDGPNGRAMFILSSKDSDIPRDQLHDRTKRDQLRDSTEWFISHPSERTKLRPLTQDSFENLFSDLLGIDG